LAADCRFTRPLPPFFPDRFIASLVATAEMAALDPTATMQGDGKMAVSPTAACNCASRDNLSQTGKQEKARLQQPGF
jgi:hypothetical protein